MTERIEAGQLVFVADGEIGVAGVREVRPHEDTFVINVQNGGDFVLPMSAVKDVHSGKVILAVDKLPEDVREALRHPHAAEIHNPSYAATDPEEGALKD
ncbi:hypothetical protein P6166_12080 [Stenotrophomonas sp. HITSZ_GD]|uniref:hypothetical protein n=1 Tax=Stenotrophomonas sp. HITSZ_GD TaxID=3037248 RepID=UPI00240DFC86|nr:hypothetical protein [Stenotrophomonas sp. HITSZ_GD]MDG2526094.1 hypothetical protein [Stenotrophomonas sp. HITSZ_GD]